MKIIVLALLLATHIVSVLAAAGPSDSAATAPDIMRYVPVGWVITQRIQGDLNGDGKMDQVAVLLRDDSVAGNPAEQPGSRGLLILFSDAAGGYRYQDFAPEALPCATCLVENPNTPDFNLALADQMLTISWSWHYPKTTEVKLTIGYDPERAALRLLRDETITTDRSSGQSGGQYLRVVRDYVAGTMITDGQESSFSPRFIPLIEVSAEDY
jgi:hypothetical protein